jgi:hypothetical protein
LTPAGVNDANAFGRSATSINFSVRVSANTPPSISVPASFTAEADSPAGWTSTWTVSAADAEDDPDPTPTCTPAAGTVLPFGVTTVSCTVSDSVGSSASDHFDVTVVDTTAPTLSGTPSDISVTTSDTGGRTVSFTKPTAADTVDPSPSVGCAPASGSLFPVGTTEVTCTASDASGNRSTGETFRVTVRYVAPRVASAVWLEPVASSASTFVANRGRTLPIKVQLFVNGSQASSGNARLQVTPCGGGTASDLPLVWSGGRWSVSLDTSSLTDSCYTVTATIGDLVAGSFTLELRDGDAVKALPKKNGLVTTTSTSTDRRTKTHTKPH